MSGYVYNYSGAARQRDVTVLLDGGSWHLETTTDSNGYYGFGGLGMGEAVLRLILRPEARSVTPEWSPSLDPGEDIIVNLGYYWGDDPPIPVILSGTLRGSTLTVQIRNRTIETSTGGLLEVTLPDGISASSQIFASQGTVEYRKGWATFRLERQLSSPSLSPKASAAGRFGLAAPLLQPLAILSRLSFTMTSS